MKTKSYLILVLAISLIFGFSSSSYAQVDTIGQYLGSSKSWTDDFSGWQGTLDDSASHHFGFSIPAAMDSIDTIFIEFPLGTRISNPGTLTNFVRPTIDSLVISAFNDSTIAITTIDYGQDGLRDTTWGAGANMRIGVNGVRTDSVPEAGGQVSGRFYIDTIRVIFDTTFESGIGGLTRGDTILVPMYLQSANPDSFYFTAVSFTGAGAADTVGQDIGDFAIRLKDRYENVVRDTVAQVAFTVVNADSPYDLRPGAGQVYDSTSATEKDTVLKPVLGTAGATFGTYAAGIYGYTKARSIRIRGSFGGDYGYLGGSADRSASTATPIISLGDQTVTLNATVPLYIVVSPTHVTDLEVVTSQQFEVWVTDKWDNPCDADSIYFIRDKQAGSYLASDGTTLITTARDTIRGLDEYGYAKFYYKAGNSIGLDTLRFTVYDTPPYAAVALATNITKKVDIKVVAGAVNKIRITPTSVTLVASPNNERYADNTYGSEGAVVAGDTVVFYAKLQDTFGNQKNVDTDELAKIYLWASGEILGVKTIYRSVDGHARWLGGGAIVSSGGYDVARFRYYTPGTISRDSVIAYYKKTSIDSIDSGIDNTIAPAGQTGTRFSTVAGPPDELVDWYLPNALTIDTIEVTSGTATSPTVQIQATLKDKNGNWADTLQTVKVRYAVKSNPGALGDAGFVYLVRTTTDDTSAHKNRNRIDLNTNLVDTTSVITAFIADSAKGTATISLSYGSKELDEIDIFKQPDRGYNEIVSTISNVNPPETAVGNTVSQLTSGFYAGATREVFVQFKDKYENIIEPDSIANDNIPKYPVGIHSLNLDTLEFTSMRVINLDADSFGAYLADTTFGGIDDDPVLMNNIGYVKVSYKALGGVFGEDTLIVRFLGSATPADSIKIVISLPEQLHHFVFTVVTQIAASDTVGMTDVPAAAGAYHTIVMRPNDAGGNPIFDQTYEYMKLELIPAADEVLDTDTTKIAPVTANKLPAIHWKVQPAAGNISLVDSFSGAAWSSVIHAGEDTIMDPDSTAVMVTSTKILSDAKIAVTVKDTAGNMVYDTLGRVWSGVAPKLLKWIPTSTDTIEIETHGQLAEQTQFKMSIVPKDIFKNKISDTAYVVSIVASDAGVSGIENQILVEDSTVITVSVDHPTTVFFAAVTNETAEGDVIGVSPVGIRGFTHVLTVTTATINAPASLSAVDAPGDASGYVLLKFPASANHPGKSGDADDNLPIDYYQVYRNAEDTSLAKSVNHSIIVATALSPQKDDTVRAVVSTNGDTRSAYYWIAAVKGKLPTGVTGSSLAKKVAAELGENVVAAAGVEESASEAKEDMAVLTEDGRLISAASPRNKARPINNIAAAALSGADLNADKIVDILDIGIILDIIDVTAEYDPAMDLNSDGLVDVFDIGRILDVFNASIPKAAAKGAPVTVANDGINVSSSIGLASSMDDLGDQFTLAITAEQVKRIAGYQFSVIYNPENYELVSVDEGGLLTSKDGPSLFIYNDKNEGSVVVAGILYDINDKYAAEGSGVLATLKFNWINDDITEITVDNIKLMDANQKLNTIEQQILEKPIALPNDFNLAQNYPNPFNPETTIKYALPKSVQVELTIYNILGQKVKTLINEEQKAGFKRITWNGTNDYGLKVASGIYIYRLKAGDFVHQMKMVFLK